MSWAPILRSRIETFGKPRRIVVDPDNKVLKNSSEVRMRASIPADRP